MTILRINIQNFATSADIASRNSRIMPAGAEPNHVCQECQEGFFFEKDLMVHSHVHTGHSRFHCTNCSNYYNTWAAMDTQHIVHQNQKYICEKCPTFSTDNPANL